MANYRQEELRVKNMLKRTWGVFFACHGHLFPIQLKAIPYVIKGKNVLVKSPTGTGKTEAVVAPLLERLMEQKWQPLSILYIVPTRALANDTIKRLQMPIEMLDLTISRKTGDFPYEFKTNNPSTILVSTPESFDSLLCRQSKIFKNLKAIILDELHLLDNTVRGDQLIFLIERLKLLYKNPEHLQFCAMSATFAESTTQGIRYFYPIEVIEDNSRKSINAHFFQYNTLDDWKIILNKIVELGFKKLIIFCNSRNEVERIAREVNLSFFKDKVWTHHGSLTKSERELVENIINERRTGICVATMTLEFGIDIGDIDAIILYRPPNSISSLMQRIGRGSRRLKDKVYAFGVYTNELERLLFEVLFQLIAEGEIDDIFYYTKYSVIIQQLLSILFMRDNRGFRIDHLIQLVSNVFQKVSESFFHPYKSLSNTLSIKEQAQYIVNETVSHMVEKRIIKIQNDIIYPCEKCFSIFNSPFLHSNIGNVLEKTLEVKNIDEARNIGIIDQQNISEGETFTLAGKNWKVVSTDGKAIYVQKLQNVKDINIKKFAYYGYPNLTYKVAQSLKIKVFSELGKYEFGLFKMGELQYLLFHFLGSLYGKLLELSYHMKYKVKIKDTSGIYFIVNSKDLFPLTLNNKDIYKCVNRYYKIFSKHMNLGKFYNYLPISLQRENILKGIRDDDLIKYLDNVSVKEL